MSNGARGRAATVHELKVSLSSTYESHYRELLEGVPEGQPSWVTSGGPGGGVYGTVAGLTAEQASRPVNGSTLAAHVEHLRWAMQLVNDYYEGERAPPDWSGSWSVSSVDEESWRRLQDDLRTVGDALLANLGRTIEWDEEMGQMAMLASYGHTAYHLGALKQLAKELGG